MIVRDKRKEICVCVCVCVDIRVCALITYEDYSSQQLNSDKGRDDANEASVLKAVSECQPEFR